MRVPGLIILETRGKDTLEGGRTRYLPGQKQLKRKCKTAEIQCLGIISHEMVNLADGKFLQKLADQRLDIHGSNKGGQPKKGAKLIANQGAHAFLRNENKTFIRPQF